MRTVNVKTEGKPGAAKYAGAAVYSSLISLVLLIALCAILSLISLKAFITPTVETIVSYGFYILAGLASGYVCSAETRKLGVLSGAVAGALLALVLYLGGILLDGNSIPFLHMLKNLALLGGAGAVGGILKMNSRK